MGIVLIIDDHRGFSDSLSSLLKLQGICVKQAFDLRQGLIESKMLTYGDVAVTDKNLGDHRGVEPLLNYLKEEKPDVYVIMASGEESTYATKELYCNTFFAKGLDDSIDLIYMITNNLK